MHLPVVADGMFKLVHFLGRGILAPRDAVEVVIRQVV
jgi:hypothetical protein